jgi:hypothetical protein
MKLEIIRLREIIQIQKDKYHVSLSYVEDRHKHIYIYIYVYIYMPTYMYTYTHIYVYDSIYNEV